MLRIVGRGSTRKTEQFLESIKSRRLFAHLDQEGKKGVRALRGATPVRTGKTAASWDYKIERGRGSVTIIWTNSNDARGTPIVLLLQYGHGTGTGGYVQGRDFINPAIQPIFDQIANDVWKKVTNG